MFLLRHSFILYAQRRKTLSTSTKFHTTIVANTVSLLLKNQPKNESPNYLMELPLSEQKVPDTNGIKIRSILTQSFTESHRVKKKS